jgi:hypothetical protein
MAIEARSIWLRTKGSETVGVQVPLRARGSFDAAGRTTTKMGVLIPHSHPVVLRWVERLSYKQDVGGSSPSLASFEDSLPLFISYR